MRTRQSTPWIPGLLATVAFASGCTDESGRSVEAFERLHASSIELIDAARDLGEAQGAELAERAEAYLAELDESIDALREQTGQQAAERLRELQERRAALTPKIEALREASGEAWNDVRDGFAEALEEFERADEAR